MIIGDYHVESNPLCRSYDGESFLIKVDSYGGKLLIRRRSDQEELLSRRSSFGDKTLMEMVSGLAT